MTKLYLLQALQENSLHALDTREFCRVYSAPLAFNQNNQNNNQYNAYKAGVCTP